MTAILQIISGPTWQHLAWALLHTLWQGAIVALLLWFVLRHVPVERPQTRYVLSLVAMLGIVLGGLVTWSVLDLKRSDPAISTSSETTDKAEAMTNSPIVKSINIADSLPDANAIARPVWLPSLVIAWLLGVALMLVRMVWQVIAVRRLARGPEVIDEQIRRIVAELQRAMHLTRPLRIVESAASLGPAVLGVLRPVLLLPASMMTGLPPDMLRAILAHELAHIRRHDYLFNLVQMTIEALLFFNPAIWWISRQIRIEREASCDALAVTITGERLVFTKALADWAERSTAAPTAAMAWNGGRRRPLLDRVGRLLLPGYSPPVPVSPRELIGSLLSIFLILCILWRGTGAIVAVAAEALSPAERVKQLVETEEQYAPSEELSAEEGKVTFTGSIRNEEGKALTSHIWATATTHQKTRSRNSSISTDISISKDASFSTQLAWGRTWIRVLVEGYAPAISGPHVGKVGEEIEGIEIILKPGFPQSIHVMDDTGKPVEGATVNGSPSVDGIVLWTQKPVLTNEQGIAVLPHVTEFQYRFIVHKPGFQPLENWRADTKSDQPISLKILRTNPTSGVIVSPDGQPIVGAEIREYARSTQGGSPGDHMNGKQGEILAISDAQGRFTLDQLYNSANYCLLVISEKYGRQLVREVTAGQKDLRIVIGPDLIVSGTIRGPLDKLGQHLGKPSISYGQSVEVEKNRWNSQGDWVPVEFVDGVGHFTIKGLFEGKVSITAGDRSASTKVSRSEPHQKVLIDLDKPNIQYGKRSIVLRFATPEGDARPKGTVRIYTIASVENKDDYKPTEFKLISLKDGEAHFEVYAPGQFNYRPEGLLGYSFDERELVTIRPDEKPLEIAVPVVPAGGIAGQVFNTDGTPLVDDSATLSIKTTTNSGSVSWDTNGAFAQDRGRFFISPLPFGAKTLILAARGNSVQLSEPITLDAAHPTVKIDLKFPATWTVSGQLLDPEGRPLVDYPITSESWQTTMDFTHAYSSKTDREGKFHFDDLSKGIGGYMLKINPRRDYQPAVYPLRNDGETIIQLDRGLVLEGEVLDVDSGWPIPGITMYAMPVDHQRGEIQDYQAEAKTDKQGRFRFSNLADRVYLFVLGDGVKWVEPASSKLRPSKDRIVVRASLTQWSTLKPQPPDSEN